MSKGVEIINYHIIENDPSFLKIKMWVTCTPILTEEKLNYIIGEMRKSNIKSMVIICKKSVNNNIRELLSCKNIIVYANIGEQYGYIKNQITQRGESIMSRGDRKDGNKRNELVKMAISSLLIMKGNHVILITEYLSQEDSDTLYNLYGNKTDGNVLLFSKNHIDDLQYSFLKNTQIRLYDNIEGKLFNEIKEVGVEKEIGNIKQINVENLLKYLDIEI